MQASGDERCGGRSVLVVDDNPGIRRVLGRLLRAHDLTAVEATSPEEAMAFAERHCFDAIILDLNLGDQSGLAVLERLRRTPGHGTIPILLLTGKTVFAREELALIQRHNAHLFLKPHLSVIDDLMRLLGHEDARFPDDEQHNGRSEGIATHASQLHH